MTCVTSQLNSRIQPAKDKTMSENNINATPGLRPIHSGNASLAIALFTVVSDLLLFLGTRLTYQANGTSTTYQLFEVPFFLLTVCVGPLLTLVGIVLGIRGLAAANPRRSRAIVGLSLNGLIALGLIVVGVLAYQCCW